MKSYQPGRAHRRGALAETLAAWWLRLKGFSILARQVSAARGSGAGELDIVARRGSLVVFAEVKARASLAEAGACLGPAQRRRISRGAEAFLARRPDLAACDVRFDAILVVPWRFPRHVADAWRKET